MKRSDEVYNSFGAVELQHPVYFQIWRRSYTDTVAHWKCNRWEPNTSIRRRNELLDREEVQSEYISTAIPVAKRVGPENMTRLVENPTKVMPSKSHESIEIVTRE